MGVLQVSLQASAIAVSCVYVLHHGRDVGSVSGVSGVVCDQNVFPDEASQIENFSGARVLRGRDFEACCVVVRGSSVGRSLTDICRRKAGRFRDLGSTCLE